MPIFQDDILTDEEELGAYTTAEAGDESFQLESLEQYPGEMPSFDFNDAPLIDADPPEIEEPSEDSINEIGEADIEDGEATMAEEISVDEGDSVWDAFGEDQNDSGEVDLDGGVEEDDVDAALESLEDDDFLSDLIGDDEPEEQSSSLDGEDDEIEQLSEQEIAELEGRDPSEIVNSQNEDNINENIDNNANVDADEDVDLDANAAELKAMLQKELDGKQVKTEKTEDKESIKEASNDDFAALDNEENAEEFNFDSLKIDKPSNYDTDDSFPEEEALKEDEQEIDPDDKRAVKKKKRNDEKKKKKKIILFSSIAVASLLLISAGLFFIMPMFDQEEVPVVVGDISNANSVAIMDDIDVPDGEKKAKKSKSSSVDASEEKDLDSESDSQSNNNSDNSYNKESDKDDNADQDVSEMTEGTDKNTNKTITKGNSEQADEQADEQIDTKDSDISINNGIDSGFDEEKGKNNIAKSKTKNTSKKKKSSKSVYSKSDKKSDTQIAKNKKYKKKANKNNNKSYSKKKQKEYKKEFASRKEMGDVNFSTKRKIAKDSDQGLFTVQIYASPSRRDAMKWVEKLKEHNISDGFISEQIVRDEIWYRVRFGKYKSKQEAREIAMKFGFTQTWIDRIK